MATLAAHTSRAGPGSNRGAGDITALYHQNALTFACKMVGNRIADDPRANNHNIRSNHAHLSDTSLWIYGKYRRPCAWPPWNMYVHRYTILIIAHNKIEVSPYTS